jgi:hypothetical protein
MKTSIILPLLALSVRVLAIPPACLLSAVNTQDEPSNLRAICGDEANEVQEAIASLCGDNAKVAQSAFIATCSSAGSSVGMKNTSMIKKSANLHSPVHGNRKTSLPHLRHLCLYHCCLQFRLRLHYHCGLDCVWRRGIQLCYCYGHRRLGFSDWRIPDWKHCCSRHHGYGKLCRRGRCCRWCHRCSIRNHIGSIRGAIDTSSNLCFLGKPSSRTWPGVPSGSMSLHHPLYKTKSKS